MVFFDPLKHPWNQHMCEYLGGKRLNVSHDFLYYSTSDGLCLCVHVSVGVYVCVLIATGPLGVFAVRNPPASTEPIDHAFACCRDIAAGQPPDAATYTYIEPQAAPESERRE